MSIKTIGLGLFIVLMPRAAVIRTGEPQTLPETPVFVEFQRATDSYAFSHRQNERRGAAPPAMTADGARVPDGGRCHAFRQVATP
jgi:hypothetical protein